jgi:predicted transcriptional regulator
MVDQSVIESFAKEVPIEVWIAIKPLSNKLSWSLFIALLKSDHQMKEDEMCELFKATPTELEKMLTPLVDCGLIDRLLPTLADIGHPDKAMYEPTFLGRSVMRSLYKAVMLGDDDIRKWLKEGKTGCE